MLACFATPAAASAAGPTINPEARAGALLKSFGDDSAKLRLFLQRMPKGGDLHNHLGGAVHAEDLIAFAAESGQCVALDPVRIAAPPCDGKTSVPAKGLDAHSDLYSRAIDGLSARGFEAGVGDPSVSGADRFFGTFTAFGPALAGHGGQSLALVRAQAAADRVSYLELQIASPGKALPAPGWAEGLAADDYPGMLARLEPILPKVVVIGREGLDRVEAEAAVAGGCAGAKPRPGCTVRTHYLLAALRNLPPPAVFAQLAYGFALVRADPRVVGVDIVAPEHDPVSVRDYRLHMAMIAFLKARYPDVALSLHAGELAMGMVPPRDLAFHIHDAVAAGATRIGHGVDIAHEEGAIDLLRQMAREHIDVEINLTSNAVILGVKGRDHPLALYRAAGVPITLSTDDEGVSRIDLTHEYVRAVTEQGLGYKALKQAARDSLTYAFAPGGSLWNGAARVPACAVLESAACLAFAQKSEKAALQRALELQFRDFEQNIVPLLENTLSSAG